jgi:hypothetical protein
MLVDGISTLIIIIVNLVQVDLIFHITLFGGVSQGKEGYYCDHYSIDIFFSFCHRGFWVLSLVI